MKVVYPVLLLCIALSSCSIQKRVHLPGYHLDWISTSTGEGLKKQHSAESVSDADTNYSAVNALFSDRIHTEFDTKEENLASEKLPALEENKLRKRTSISKKNEGQNNARKPVGFNTIAPANLGALIPDETDRLEGFSLASLILGMLFYAAPFISSIFAIVALIFPLLAIIFGAIGISRTKKNSALVGKGLAIAGLVLGIIGLLAIAFLVLLLLFAFPIGV